MTHRQDDPSAPARGADILPFRRPASPPVSSPDPAPQDDGGDDDGPTAA
jgi:hypothetical protein